MEFVFSCSRTDWGMVQVTVQYLPPGAFLLPMHVHVIDGFDEEARVAGVIIGHREPEEKRHVNRLDVDSKLHSPTGVWLRFPSRISQ